MQTQNEHTGQTEDGGEPSIVCHHSPQPALLARLRLPLSQVEASLAPAMARLVEQLHRERLSLAAAPFIAYHELSLHTADLELGLPVAATARGSQELHVGSIPMGRYLTFAHLSWRRPLTDEFRAMQHWLGKHAERTSGPLYAVVSLDRELYAGEPVVLIQRRIIAGGAEAQDLVTGALTDHVWELVAGSIVELARLAAQLLPLPAAAPARKGPPTRKTALLVRDAMNEAAVSCRRSESAQRAAQLMWEQDVGALPVLDEGTNRPIAMITDRDLCMAAYTQGKRLDEIAVATAMSQQLHVCRPDDALSAAEGTMKTHQIRRLPVVSPQGVLLGILSMNDIILTRGESEARDLREDDPWHALAIISQHRGQAGKDSSRPD